MLLFVTAARKEAHVTEINTPVIPPVPAVPCPTWCIACDGRDEGIAWHGGEEMKIPVSNGTAGRHSGDITAVLGASNGERPHVDLFRGDQLAELSIAEAEHMAAVLMSLAAQARTATIRFDADGRTA